MCDYGNKLQLMSRALEGAGFSAFIRGDGEARLVCSEHNNRAVEMSHDGTGFFIELFDQPSEISMRDYQQDTIALATEQAIEWLSGNEDTAY